MTKDLYNESYFIDKDTLPVHLLMTLEEIIEENSYKNILETACGTGRLFNGLKKEGRKVYGCDLSVAAAKKAGALVADVVKLPYGPGSFDLIIGVSVIEHLDEKTAESFLKEAGRLLKKGGAIFLVTPNFSSPMRYLKGKQWFGYSDPTHIKFYTPCEMRNKLEANGFSDVNMRFKLGSYPDFNWGLSVNLPFINRFISRIFISSPLALLRDSFWVMAHSAFPPL